MNEIKNTIENAISGLDRFINRGKINQLRDELISQQVIASSSRLGVSAQSTAGGFLSLVESVDDKVASVAESIPANSTNELVIGQLTSGVPGLGNKLITAVENTGDLQSILGSSQATSTDMNDLVVSLGTPEAIAAAVKQTVPTATTAELNNVVSDLVDLSKPLVPSFSTIDDLLVVDTQALQSQLFKSISAVTQTIDGPLQLKNQVFSTINGNVSKLVNEASAGFGSLVENIVESVFFPASNIIGGVSKINGLAQQIPESELRNIIANVSAGQPEQALKVLRKYSDLSDAELLDALNSIDNRASTATARPTPGVSVVARNLENGQNSWNGVNTPRSVFTVINNKEELLADLLGADREITEIVVHHTFTGINQNLDAFDIHEMHRLTYNLGIDYHYVFSRDGNIQRGKPVGLKVESTYKNDHQEYSIHVAFVGGLNIPASSNQLLEIEKNLSSKSFTQNQWKAFNTFVETAFKAYPGIQVLGHNSIDEEAQDPNFDPSEYVEAKFGKKLLFTDPTNQRPFSRQQLIERNIQT
jgi:hypothetical protein